MTLSYLKNVVGYIYVRSLSMTELAEDALYAVTSSVLY